MSSEVSSVRYHAKKAYELWLRRASMAVGFKRSDSHRGFIYQADGYIVIMDINGAIKRTIKEK